MIFAKKVLEWTLEVGFFLIFVIFVFHGPWIMHWVFWKVLIVKAITPSILVRFSKFLCLNTSAFQDLSFSFTAHPRDMCPHGQKHVLKWVHEKQKSQKLKKSYFQGPFQLFLAPKGAQGEVMSWNSLTLRGNSLTLGEIASPMVNSLTQKWNSLTLGEIASPFYGK